MKTIPLTKGYVALVSDEDFECVNAHKWYAEVDSHTVYASRSSSRRLGKRTMIKMHRFIMGVTDPTIEVDHKNHDGLNNQRENLRVCFRSQNMSNTRKRQGTSSQFKGVTWQEQDGKSGKWKAQIRLNKRQTYLGLFSDPIDAAMAFDDAARQHFGAFALTNFPQVVVEVIP